MSSEKKSILVTGGAGFIGTELSLLLQNDPRFDRICILSRDWHKHAALKAKLTNQEKFRWFLGDVRDLDRLKRAFNGVDWVVSAAANKDVVSCAYNPREALLTNTVGSQNVIDSAIDCGVEKVLLISSDKATGGGETLYGQTKSVAEGLFVAANTYSPGGTKFSVSRYGNVLFSAGSAGHLFVKQRDENRSITITHPAMTRFWFQPKLAVQFILQCLDAMRGGEVFVPKLPASRVVDFAKAIAPDSPIEIIGIRPAERIHELMVSETESHRTEELDWAYRINPAIRLWSESNPYPPGSPVPWGWEYSSASATRLTVEQLRSML